VVLPFFLVHDGVGIIEPLVTLVMASALYLQLELVRRPDLRVAALLGLVLAAGVLTKENTKPALALIPLSLLCFNWSRADRRRRLALWLAGIGIATVMVIGAALLLRASSRYGEFQASRHDPLLYTVRTLGAVLADPFAELGKSWSVYRPALSGYLTIPLVAAAIAGAVLGVRSRPRMTAVLVAWIAVPLGVSLLFTTLPYPRHVMYVVPPAVVLMAYALVEGTRWLQTAFVRGSTVASVVAVGGLLAPALLFDARVLARPGTASYPGVDDLQYVTGTGGGSVWPGVAEKIRQRGKGRRVVVVTPRAYAQVVEMLLGPDPRFVFVSGRSPLARRAQFSIEDEIPFFDPEAAAVAKEGKFVPIARFKRPGGGAEVTLYERPG
jgi:4-amino-4-deoxy-L-arabinose transferase-like glycosyltransferase